MKKFNLQESQISKFAYLFWYTPGYLVPHDIPFELKSKMYKQIVQMN